MDIRAFPLAWRWTDSRYAVLPTDILEQMRPAERSEAAALFEHSLAYAGEDGLNPELFALTEFSTAEASVGMVREWLIGLVSGASTEVVLSWQPDTAIRTPWNVFCDYWQEFCYPAADDLMVWPANEEWVLLYHHEERFYFGRKL